MQGIAVRQTDGSGSLGQRLLARDVVRAHVSWYGLLMVAVLALAAWVRFAELGFDSLSHAEAWRANWSHHGSWGQMRRMPPLQVGVLWLMQHTLGRTEFAVRLPSAIAGTLCVLLIYGFSRRHAGCAAALAVAAAAAFHPVLIQHSRSAKVFGIEPLVIVLLLWAALEAYQHKTSRSLMRYLAAGLVGLALTFTASLTIAATLPLIAWSVLRERDRTKRPLRPLVVVAATLLVAGVGWFIWLNGNTARDSVVHYFGTIEPAWPRAYTPAVLAQWLVSHTYGAGRYLLGMSSMWTPLDWIVGMLELVAVMAGVGVVWRRCRPLGLFAITLFVIVVLAGAARKWPYGDFRMMTFLIPLATIAIGCGIAEIGRRFGRAPVTALLVTGCLLVPMARAAHATLGAPHVSEHCRPVFEYVAAHKRPGDALFIYYPVDDAFRFYWHDESTAALVQPRSDRGDFERFSGRFADWIEEHPRVWFVFTHPWADEREQWLGHLLDTYTLADKFERADASAHLFFDQKKR